MDDDSSEHDDAPSDSDASTTTDDASTATAVEPEGPREGPGGREVVVPLRLYKTITVFSTLIAVVGFILGFILIDAATLQVSLLRSVIVAILSTVGLVPSQDVLTALLALGGLSLIAGSAVVYVVGTRFRAQGMGKSQEDSPEGSDNG
ncbi:MAG: hypothetical protein ABEH81_15855 [Halopenitus sp.]